MSNEHKENRGNRGVDPQPNRGNDEKGHQDKSRGPKERGRDAVPGNSGALTSLWTSIN